MCVLGLWPILNSVQLTEHLVCLVALVVQVRLQVQLFVLQELLQLELVRSRVQLLHDAFVNLPFFEFFIYIDCLIEIHSVKRLDVLVNF